MACRRFPCLLHRPVSGTALIILTLLFTAAGEARTERRIYVAANGSDKGKCSEAAPCRQVRRALALVSAGDTIVVADGTYRGFDVIEIHGTAQAPIVITAPGRGAEILPTSDRRDNRANIFISESSHIELDGFRSFKAPRYGVRVSHSHHVTLRNGVFGANNHHGIFTGHAHDLVIEGNECYGSRTSHGIYLSNSGDRPIVRRNSSHDNAKAGIQLNADASMGGDGIITGALIEANVLYNNGSANAAINLDGVQDSIVRNNLLYNNRGTAIAIYRIDGAEGPRGMQILHNTVDVPTNGRTGLSIKNSAGPNIVRNNILYNRNRSAAALKYYTLRDIASTDSDYNVINRITPDDDDTMLTLKQWQDQGHEEHSLSVSPAALWVDPAAGNYRLSASSPAIDRGWTLAPVPVDLEGSARPRGDASDIGAYEAGPGPFDTLESPADGASGVTAHRQPDTR